MLESQGTSWQLIKDYQFRRIFTFLDPSADPLGAGYHITQAKIAMGSGGLVGRGYMQGTQSRLNFLPEKHTDFILTTPGRGVRLRRHRGASRALRADRGLLHRLGDLEPRPVRGAADRGRRLHLPPRFAVNMGMVMGLMPVVGVPLPLVSYGGSAMIVLLAAFGLVQSAHVHRPRNRD